jgi:IS4 transposase
LNRYCTSARSIKLHTLLDLRGAIKTFIHISDGKLGDVNALDLLTFGAGAFYVMDRGDVDFARLYALHQTGGCFVTGARSPIDAPRLYSVPVDRATGVICDQRVMLNGYQSARRYPELCDAFDSRTPASCKTLVLLTNNTTLPASKIAALCKSRWSVELLSKWVRPNLRIKHPLGNSETAVRTQV